MGKELYLVEETNSSFNVDYVASLPQSAFWRGTDDIVNELSPRKPVWAKLSFHCGRGITPGLIIDFSVIDIIDIYYRDAKNEMRHLRSGNFAFSPQSYQFQSFTFLLVGIPEGNNTIYIRISTSESYVLPVKLIDSRDLMQSLAHTTLDVIYLGITLMALLFNLSLFAQAKRRSNLIYSTYIIITSIFLLLYMRGYSHYIYNDNIRLTIMSYGLLLFMGSMFCLLLFTNDFLQVKRYYPKAVSISYVLMIFLGLGGLFSILSFRYIACVIGQLLLIAIGIYILVVGIALLRNKKFTHEFPVAKYYLIGWMISLSGHVYYIFGLAGIVEITDLGLQLPIICSAIEFIFLTMAQYSHRFKILNVKNMNVEQENMKLIKERNIYLEEKVNERTQEMKILIDALEGSNGIKDRMFSIIAHDLRSPVNNFISLLHIMNNNLASPEELAEMMSEVNKDAQQIQKILDNLLDWSLLQFNEKESNPERIALKQFLEDHYQVYHLLVKNKNITATVVCDDDMYVTADRNHLSLILRNLIDNAIKFTPINGRIEIGVREELMRKCAIYVSNTGKGITRPTIKNILRSTNMKASQGTANEKGVGLGLQLCKEFIKNMYSELKIESIENELTTFWFELPLIRIAKINGATTASEGEPTPVEQ